MAKFGTAGERKESQDASMRKPFTQGVKSLFHGLKGP